MYVINLRVDQEDVWCISALLKLNSVLNNIHTSVHIVTHILCDNLMAIWLARNAQGYVHIIS